MKEGYIGISISGSWWVCIEIWEGVLFDGLSFGKWLSNVWGLCNMVCGLWCISTYDEDEEGNP